MSQQSPYPLMAILLLFAGTTGCLNLADLHQDPPSKSQYLLAAAPKTTAAATANGGGSAAEAAAERNLPVLAVNKAYVAAPFHEKSFVYRIGENQYTTDYYQEFLVSPSQMVTQLTVDWLRKSGTWPTVQHGSEASGATRGLDLNLLELYGDYRQADSQQAVVRLRATLWAATAEDGSRRPAMEEEYSARVDIADREAKTLVQGLNDGLEQVLEKLAKDVRKKR